MTMHDDNDRPGDDGNRTAPPDLLHPKRNRSKTIASIAGIAAVLGAGSYLTTTLIMNNNSGETQDVAAVRALDPQGPAAPGPAASGSDGTSPGKAGGGKTVGGQAANPEPSFEEPSERVRKAREAAQKDGVKITRPLPVKDNPAGAAAAAAAKEQIIGSAKEGGTMRIVTVRGDLAGQREIGWVAGGIKKHGKVECSQRFKLYNEQKPKTRPSLLVCWRTSADRSVIVVDTKIGGRPAVAKSLSVIDREWRKLG
jgi:hypothetical protein